MTVIGVGTCILFETTSRITFGLEMKKNVMFDRNGRLSGCQQPLLVLRGSEGAPETPIRGSIIFSRPHWYPWRASDLSSVVTGKYFHCSQSRSNSYLTSARRPRPLAAARRPASSSWRTSVESSADKFQSVSSAANQTMDERPVTTDGDYVRARLRSPSSGLSFDLLASVAQLRRVPFSPSRSIFRSRDKVVDAIFTRSTPCKPWLVPESGIFSSNSYHGSRI